ncbi:MAG TPA: cupin domain-containing protein [Bacillales bacterium]|nr:cupin domain-containing protein [Bacillales bacterium]
MKKNIREAQVFDDNRMKKVSLIRHNGSEAFLINLMPGQTLPSHKHPGHQVFLLVLEGEGECAVGGETQSFEWRDVLHSSGDTELSVSNTGRKMMSVYVVLTKDQE